MRSKFLKEVGAYRVRQARASTALIVVIDADALTVQDRLTQLDRALTDGGKQVVSESEQIARLIPKRNIETWILCLNEHAVDEETDYKETRRDWKVLIPPAAETLFRWTRQRPEPPSHCIDSLRSGLTELNRLNF